jgi:hypothetical protein
VKFGKWHTKRKKWEKINTVGELMSQTKSFL